MRMLRTILCVSVFVCLFLSCVFFFLLQQPNSGDSDLHAQRAEGARVVLGPPDHAKHVKVRAERTRESVSQSVRVYAACHTTFWSPTRLHRQKNKAPRIERSAKEQRDWREAENLYTQHKARKSDAKNTNEDVTRAS